MLDLRSSLLGPSTGKRKGICRKLQIILNLCALLGITLFLPGLSVASEEDPAQSFDGMRAFQHLRSLVAIGPRPSGSAASGHAQKYLMAELEEQGLEVRQQMFTADTPAGDKAMNNIIGIIEGHSRDIIIIGAHYDTKYFEEIEFVGANDGTSGPAVLLELARCIQSQKTAPSIWLVFFDGEEAFGEWSDTDSLYGSRHFVEQLKKSGELARVKAMILLDMVGDADLSVGVELHSTSWMRTIVWEHAKRLGYEKYFVSNATSIKDDHIPFLKERIPALNIIDFQYGPKSRSNEFWHTAEDTLDKVSPNSLKIVGEVVLGSLPEIAAAAGGHKQKRK